MARLFRIIGSSDPEPKLKRFWDLFRVVVGHLYLSVCDVVGVLPDRVCIFRSSSVIAPRSLQLCLSQAAQKTFLGGVLPTEFPQCGLECIHPALAEREITQVNQKSDRLVVFVGLPLLDVRCNPIPIPFLSLPQLVQIARAVSLVFCLSSRSLRRSLCLQ